MEKKEDGQRGREIVEGKGTVGKGKGEWKKAWEGEGGRVKGEGGRVGKGKGNREWKEGDLKTGRSFPFFLALFTSPSPPLLHL